MLDQRIPGGSGPGTTASDTEVRQTEAARSLPTGQEVTVLEPAKQAIDGHFRKAGVGLTDGARRRVGTLLHRLPQPRKRVACPTRAAPLAILHGAQRVHDQ